MGDWADWQTATRDALYGPDGFYRQAAGPAAHFRTSPHASPLFAGALLTLVQAVDAELRHPAVLDLVDVGAGRGELLRALADAAARRDQDLARRLRLAGVEVTQRPAGLPEAVGWASSVEAACPAGVHGLLVGNEWLDNVPTRVVERAEDGVRLVRVDRATGRERLGQPPTGPDAAWLAHWWPLAEIGERAEIGRPRDQAWAHAVGLVRRGLALAVDYGHLRESRPPLGSLRGYRAGRDVPPVPDGRCDITSDVALDACLAAGVSAGASGSLLTTQRAALRALGVSGARPDYQRAHTDPLGYLRALAVAGDAAELTDPGGLGGFHWLVQTVDVPVPTPLADLPGPS